MFQNDNINIVLDADKIPTILLVGNGISRAYGAPSWDDLLKKITVDERIGITQESLNGVPNPLKAVILSDDHLDAKMKEIAEFLLSYTPPEEEQKHWASISSLPIKSILTTNYSYEIEKSLHPGFKVTVGKSSAYRKRTDFQGNTIERRELATYMKPLPDSVPIWHIHGEAGIPDSMTIGHYYYGDLISKAQQRISKIIKKYNACKKAKKDFVSETWVDLFMLCNVRIVGLRLDYSEFDLWWLLNCKKKHFPETRVDWYDVDIESSKKLMAKTYYINCHSTEHPSSLIDENAWFRAYYSSLLANLKV